MATITRVLAELPVDDKYTVQGLGELKKNVGLSNGMAWNDKTNKFYFCDSYDLNVKEYDFDMKTGTFSKFSNDYKSKLID